MKHPEIDPVGQESALMYLMLPIDLLLVDAFCYVSRLTLMFSNTVISLPLTFTSKILVSYESSNVEDFGDEGY